MAIGPVLILAGPTAVGKSSLALAVAEAVGAGILSADSRQVYRGLDIGTAKASAAERERVPHHLVDVLDAGEPYSAGQFLRDAREIIERLHERRTPAVVVGGSTLYVHALVRGLADLPPLDPELTESLAETTASEAGRDALYAELLQADPEAAATLDPTKTHRLVRLVGVLRSTGRPPSEQWAESTVAPVPNHLVVLNRSRSDLYAAIDRRVLDMIDRGLVAEAAAVYERGEPARRTLRSTIGYRELIPVLEGTRDLDEAVRLIQRNSRRYAKRQLTWYRRYPEAVWADATETSAVDLLDRLGWPSST